MNGVISDGPPPLVSYTHDKAGRLTHSWHENGIIEKRTYDKLTQLTNIEIGTTLQPTLIGSHSYTHDATGRRTAHNNTGTNVNYTYDNADQVTASTGDISRALNQYTALTNSATPTYDANGNTMTMSGATFDYDQKNQLKFVSGLDSNSQMVTVTHSYDPMGRRISSTKNAQTTIFAYDGWNVVEEYNSTTPATPTQIHTWGTDLSGRAQGAGGVGGLLFTEDLVANTTWHHHYDGNGNVTHLTNAAAQGVGIYTYDAFGNTVTATGTAATNNKYRFSTKPLDEEIANTPLYYYGYRFYNPLTARWINRDPIEENGGLNLYGFVGNDGLNIFDKLGLIDENSSVEKIEAEVKELINSARNKGMNVAADMLQNYINGGGNQVLSSSWLRSFGKVQDAEKKNQKRFEASLEQLAKTMNCGETKVFQDYRDAQITYKGRGFSFDELFFASGDSALKSTGKFTLKKDCWKCRGQRGSAMINMETVLVKGTVEHHWHDPYNWNPGQGVCIPGSGRIPDSALDKLRTHGKAKNFNMTSDWSQTASVVIRYYPQPMAPWIWK